MDTTWGNILWFLAIGGFFVMMMRRGGGCCGGGHRHHDKSGHSQQPETKNTKDITLESIPVDGKPDHQISNRSAT